jgi:hypothetical protein
MLHWNSNRYIKLFHPLLTSGCTMIQAVIHGHHDTEPWIQSQKSLHEICGAQSGTGTDSPLSTSIFLSVSFHHCSILIHSSTTEDIQTYLRTASLNNTLYLPQCFLLAVNSNCMLMHLSSCTLDIPVTEWRHLSTVKRSQYLIWRRETPTALAGLLCILFESSFLSFVQSNSAF